MDPKQKKTERISKSQKEKLVEFMSANLEFARGQINGLNSNTNYKEQWETLTMYLNSLGGSAKSVDQWKKCCIDLKSGVKKTVNNRRKFLNKTGGGSIVDVPKDLNSLEERILGIISMDAVDGDSCTPESGFPIEQTAEDFLSVDFLEGEELYMPPAKKQKEMPSTSQKLEVNQPTKNNLSKYAAAIEEAREKHNKLEKRLEKIETQNEIIIDKLNSLEKTLETFLSKCDNK